MKDKHLYALLVAIVFLRKSTSLDAAVEGAKRIATLAGIGKPKRKRGARR
jgi:hypothetical protein